MADLVFDGKLCFRHRGMKTHTTTMVLGTGRLQTGGLARRGATPLACHGPRAGQQVRMSNRYGPVWCHTAFLSAAALGGEPRGLFPSPRAGPVWCQITFPFPPCKGSAGARFSKDNGTAANRRGGADQSFLPVWFLGLASWAREFIIGASFPTCQCLPCSIGQNTEDHLFQRGFIHHAHGLRRNKGGAFEVFVNNLRAHEPGNAGMR